MNVVCIGYIEVVPHLRVYHVKIINIETVETVVNKIEMIVSQISAIRKIHLSYYFE